MSIRKRSAAVVRLAAAIGVLVAGGPVAISAQSSPKPAGKLILGELTSLAVRDMNDAASGGRLVVDGKTITVPDRLLIGVPSGRVSLRDLMLEAPAGCRSQQPPQSGLGVSDSCRGERPPALARVVASPDASGELVASVVMIQKDSGRTLARTRPQRDRRAPAYGQPSSYGASTPQQSEAQAK